MTGQRIDLSLAPADEVAVHVAIEPLRRALDRRRESAIRERAAVVAEWERRRRSVQRALHDGAQQQLLGIRLGLLRCGTTIPATDRDVLAQRLEEVIADIDALASGGTTRAMTIDDIDAAITEIAEQSGLRVHVDARVGRPLAAELGELVAATLSESLANVHHHAGVDECTVVAEIVGSRLELRIVDRGRGGAHRRSGRGLAALQRRVVALSGSLEIAPAGDDVARPGTLVCLQLEVNQQPTEPVGTATDELEVAPLLRDRARHELDDPSVEISIDVDGFGARDETGAPSRLGAAADAVSVVLVVGDRIVGRLWTGAEPDRVADWTRRNVRELRVAEARALLAADAFELVERRRSTDRFASALRASLARRLASAPIAELRAALDRLLVGDGPDAAQLVLRATTALREVVQALEERATALDTGDEADPFLFGLLGQQTGVAVRARVNGVPDGVVREAIANVCEQIVSDVAAGSSVSIRVECSHRRATLVVDLDGLPSPRAVAFSEETARWLRGEVQCHEHQDRVRMRLELPCES